MAFFRLAAVLRIALFIAQLGEIVDDKTCIGVLYYIHPLGARGNYEAQPLAQERVQREVL